jgi:hypothetical protein
MHPWRLVQVRTNQSIGSGYLIRPDTVLTAAHVVDGVGAFTPVEARLRFDGQERVQRTPVHDIVFDFRQDSDIAVLSIDALDYPDAVIPPVIARVRGTAAEVLDGVALGYPRWKLRDQRLNKPPNWDRARITGRLNLTANDYSGGLEFELTGQAPPSDPAVRAGEGASPSGAPAGHGAAPGAPSRGRRTPPRESAWAGMSGGSVWVGQTLVGVVSENFTREGTGRLTVRPIEALYDGGPKTREVRDALWLPERLTGLPAAGAPVTSGFRHEEAFLTSQARYLLVMPDGTGIGLEVNERYVVGSGTCDSCDIVVQDGMVVAQHCAVSVAFGRDSSEQVVFVSALGAVTAVNGRIITTATRLQAGDVIQIGLTQLRLDAAPSVHAV